MLSHFGHVWLFATLWIMARQAPLFMGFSSVQFSSVQLLRHVQLFATPWTAAGQTSLSITNSQSLLKLMSIEFVMPSSHLILCRLLLLLPSILPSIRVFSSESVLCIRWPRYQSFSISPSNDYSGLISFKINWFDLLAVQGTLKSLFQQHSSVQLILVIQLCLSLWNSMDCSMPDFLVHHQLPELAQTRIHRVGDAI